MRLFHSSWNMLASLSFLLLIAGQNYALMIMRPPPWAAFTFEDAIQHIFVPKLSFSWEPFTFWEDAKALGHKLIHYTDTIIKEAESKAGAEAHKVVEFKNGMVDLVKKAGELRLEFTNAIEAKNVTMEKISDELSLLANATYEYLKITFPHPDKAPSHEERRVMISAALEHIEENLVTLAVKYEIPEERVRPIVRDIRNVITPILTTCGDLIEQHPDLLEVILFAGAAILLEEVLILRPILSIFGFGPAGPVKGSAAAWAQRRFWGAVVEADSWFARLQRAGMTIRPGVGKAIFGGIALGVATVFSCWK